MYAFNRDEATRSFTRAAEIDDDTLRKIGPAVDRWWCSVYDVQKRFGRWDAILA